MSKFTDKKLKETRIKTEIIGDDTANYMKLNKRTISHIKTNQENVSAGNFAQFSRIYNVYVRK